MASLRSIPRLRPYGASSSSKNIFSGGFAKPKVYGTSPKQLTLQELLQLQQLNKPKHHSIGSLLHKATHSLETALDYTARPSYALMEGLREEGHSKKRVDLKAFYHGLGQGIHAHKRTSLGDIIREQYPHFAKKHKVLTAAGGFTGDVVTDPTNLLLIAAAPETGGASLAALAEKESAMGVARGTLMKTSEKLLKGGLDKKELKSAVKLYDRAGPEWNMHKALAEHALDHKGLSENFMQSFKEAAATEAKQLTKNPRLALQLQIPFLRKNYGKFLTKGRLSVVLPGTRTPSLMRVAEGKGILGNLTKIVGGPKIAEALGHALKPGWRNEKFHALELTAHRVHTQQVRHLLENLRNHVAGPHAHLSEQQMRDALIWAEKKGENFAPHAGRKINSRLLNGAVKKGALTKEQASFLRDWHAYTESLRAADIGHGIQYDKDIGGQIYVPHPYSLTGEKMDAQAVKSYLTKHGFQYERVPNGGNDMQAIDNLAKAGEKDVITNPIDLLAQRARRGAQGQSESLLRHVVAAAEGVPTHIANEARIKQLADEFDKREVAIADELAKKQMLLHSAGHELVLRHRARLAQAEQKHQHELETLRTKIRSNRAKLGVERKKAGRLPSYTKLVRMSLKDLRAHPIIGADKKTFAKVLTIVAPYKIAVKFERKAARLTAKSGAKPHGSNYKRLLGEMADEMKASKEVRESLFDRAFSKGETWKTRFDGYVEQTKKHYASEWAKATDNLNAKKDPFREARIKQMTASIQKKQAEFVEKQAQLEQKFVDEQAMAEKALRKRLRPIEKRIANHQQRIEQIPQLAEHHLTSLRNPNVPEGHVAIDRLRDANGSPLAVPKEMADALTRMQRFVSDDKLQEEFKNVWRRTISRWKVAVTVINPGYRFRNTASDMWNMYADGVPIWAMNVYGGQAFNVLNRVSRAARKVRAGEKLTAKEQDSVRVFWEAYRHGILSGLFEGDVKKTMERLHGQQDFMQLLKRGKGISAIEKLATDFNRQAENWGRLTHYLYRMRYDKMSAVEAAHHVRAAHFDYEDLTPFERKLKGSLIPFYTWTRKNIPFQITQMVSRPGRYSALQKGMNESEGAADVPKGTVLPSWMQGNLAFHVPFGGPGAVTQLQFGPTDIEKLQHPMQGAASMLNPFMKTAIELEENKSLLTGAPIYARGSDMAHPRNPVSKIGADILQFLPGANVGQTSRNVGGKKVSGPGANPLFTYLAGQTPLSNLLVNTESNIKSKQRGSQNPALGWLTGLTTYQPDQQATIMGLEAEQSKAFKRYIRGLRDEGILPEPKRKKSKFQKQLDRELAKQARGG